MAPIRPCDLSTVEDSLVRLWAGSARTPAILATTDAAHLFVRVMFRGTVRPHRVFLDLDDDRATGWWTDGERASASGWDLMVDLDGSVHRHDGPAGQWSWMRTDDNGYARSARSSSADLRLPVSLIGSHRPVRIGVEAGDAGWAPHRFLPGARFPFVDETTHERPDRPPQRLAVHIGPRPWRVRGCVAPADAAEVYAEFAHVVLGGGLDAQRHPEHGRAAQLVAAIRAAQPGIEVWGQVSLVGGPANPDGRREVYEVAQIVARAQSWRSMGATGVFLSDAALAGEPFEPGPRDLDGRPVEITRARQQAVVDAVHSLGMGVFAHAGPAVADLLCPAPVLGLAGVGRPADMVLIEGVTYTAGAEGRGRERMIVDAALELGRRARASRGIRVAGLDTLAGIVDDAMSRTTAFRIAWRRAVEAGLDAYGVTNPAWSASDALETNLALAQLPS